jgi:hypothetical protein
MTLPRTLKTTMFFSLKKQVCFLDLPLCFPFFSRVLLIKDWRLLTLYHFSAATTLINLSRKEKDSLNPEASTSSFGLGIDPSMLEPDTRWLLLSLLSRFYTIVSLLKI